MNGKCLKNMRGKRLALAAKGESTSPAPQFYKHKEEEFMISLFYITAKYNKKFVDKHTATIEDTPLFEVRRVKFRKGYFVRIPKNIADGEAVNVFIHHSLNLSQTLKSKTICTKIEFDLVPVQCGEFKGFYQLEGEQYDPYFVPDYQNPNNIKRIAILPPQINKRKINSALKKLGLFNLLNEEEFDLITEKLLCDDAKRELNILYTDKYIKCYTDKFIKWNS